MQRLILIMCVIVISCTTNQKKESQRDSNEILFQGEIFGFSDSLYVDFQGGFRNDSAVVLLNDKVIKTLNLYSDGVLGLADNMVIPISSINKLELNVFRINGKRYSVSVDSVNSNFLGFYFNYTIDDLAFGFSKDPFMYE